MNACWEDKSVPTPIYFDNAATSWPKPEAVREAVGAWLGGFGGNPGRSGHSMSVAAARMVESSRETVGRLLGADDPSRILFTSNATHALNLALCGLLRPGDHVVTTSLEHNSVMRPLRHLETTGVALTVAACAEDGTLDWNALRAALRPATRLLVATHASNVAGTLMPLAELADFARQHGILLLVDAAQTAGAVPIDVRALGVGLLAFTGHKSLLGPTGTGGLYIAEGVELSPLMRGGTGSNSALETQPDFLPDALESGTPNVAGIAGLGAAVRFLADIGVERVRAHELGLVNCFLEGAAKIAGLTVYGPANAELRCGVVSFNIAGAAPSEVASILDQSFGILCRPGLHCAPAAHRTLGTFPMGTVRFGFGWFNRENEVETALQALAEIAAWSARERLNPGGTGT